MVYMIKEERKVGPKGQVVIPKVFRKSKKIEPGSKVIFESKDGKLVIEKPEEETEKVFEEVAKKGKKVKRKIGSHEAHDEELEERL